MTILQVQNNVDFEKLLELDKIGLSLQFPQWKRGDTERQQVLDPARVRINIQGLIISESSLKHENLSSKTQDEIQTEILNIRNELVNLKNKKLTEYTEVDDVKKTLCELALKNRELYLAGKK